MFKCFSSSEGDFEDDEDILAFTLIKDTLQKSGRPVLKGFAAQLPGVHCISYELPVELFSEGLDNEKIELLDAFSDPFSWKDPSSNENYFSPGFLREIDVFSPVVIDSLSSYLVHNTVQTLYKSIHKRAKEGNVYGLLHTDSHTPEDCALIESLATTVIEIIPDSKPDLNLCRVTIRQIAKKPRMKICSYTFDSNSFKNMKIKEHKIQDGSSRKNKKADPAANLTFNLNLTEIEKKSRSEVPLPFVKNSGVVSEVQPVNNDNDDDFDEEDDPDDDLDF